MKAPEEKKARRRPATGAKSEPARPRPRRSRPHRTASAAAKPATKPAARPAAGREEDQAGRP